MKMMEFLKQKSRRKKNLADANKTIAKFSSRYNACETEEEKQSFITSLTDEEKREIGNVATYIKLQSLMKFSSMTPEEKQALLEGRDTK